MTKRDNSARRLLRLRPASEYLSVSPATVRTLCQRGEIPIIRLTESGHAPWLIDVRDLETYRRLYIYVAQREEAVFGGALSWLTALEQQISRF
jgi:Helix-turn-helix domain